MSSAGVIINPISGRGNGKGLALVNALQNHKALNMEILQSFENLEPTLKRMLAAGLETLFVSSGDGTVQAVQTYLAENGASPRLCILPHGTTNMTAADIGFRHKSIAAQAAFIVDVKPVVLRERATIRVANPRDEKPRHGMFLGTGALSEAARYTQTTLNDRGVKGGFATFATLAGSVGKSLFSTPNAFDPNRFDRPFPISVKVDGVTLSSGMQLLALATTLDKLVLGTRPFWGGKDGPIRITTFPYPLPSLPRWFLPAVMGGEQRTPPPGAKSVATRAAEIDTPMNFVIDGEFFSPTPGEALRISAGPVFTYVVA